MPPPGNKDCRETHLRVCQPAWNLSFIPGAKAFQSQIGADDPPSNIRFRGGNGEIALTFLTLDLTL